jgi:hypothetical protein
VHPRERLQLLVQGMPQRLGSLWFCVVEPHGLCSETNG